MNTQQIASRNGNRREIEPQDVPQMRRCHSLHLAGVDRQQSDQQADLGLKQAMMGMDCGFLSQSWRAKDD